MTTAAEALDELATLAMRARAAGAHPSMLMAMLDTARDIADNGWDPIAELRMRGYRRRYGDGGYLGEHGHNGC